MITIGEACTGCGACVEDCVAQVLALRDGRAVVNGDCLQCGHCVALCPVGAPVIGEYDMDGVEAVEPERFASPAALLHMVKARRSIRQYREQPVEREKLELIFQAGRYTATAVNCQGCRFIAVQDQLPVLKQTIWEGIGTMLAAGRPEAEPYRAMYEKKQRDPEEDFLFRNAPAVVFVASQRILDAGLAAQDMELAAVAQGLGMLYNGFLVRAASMIPGVTDWLGAEDRPLAACMLVGYPAATYRRTAPRKAADCVWR